MTTKTNFEPIGFYESVIAIAKNYLENGDVDIITCRLENNYEFEDCLKFNDVLKCCKFHGYKNGTILLILESYLDGKIYRYGNYKDDELWHEVGSMIGFA